MLRKIILLLACCAAALAARCQLPVGMPDFYAPTNEGTMMPLQFPELKPSLPDTLTPIFVSHIGRHGARFLSSPEKIGQLRKAMDEVSSLTNTGEAMRSLINRVVSHTAGRWGALDSIGRAEQREVARRLNTLLPGFFKEGNILAISSYVPRCVASMYSFCEELSAANPTLQISASSGPAYNSLLRFFTTDKAYADFLKNGDWKKIYDEYFAATVPTAPARRLSVGFEPLSDTELQQITMWMYGVLQALPAAGMDDDVFRFMSPEEYRACYLVANLEHALRRTATPWSTLPAKAARPLLRQIIDSADAALPSAENQPIVKGEFRFGHAETIMPLFSLMGIPGCIVAPDATPATLAQSWNDSFVSPLAANLQLIFCKTPSGEICVFSLLNGRQIDLLPGATNGVCNWAALRDYWEKRMNEFH